MNLITDRWIPVRRQNGAQEKIAPWQIAEQINPVLEIDAPRADFQGALYQLLIGLLQTVYSPETTDDWYERYLEPDADNLKAAFARLQPAMALLNPEGPAFLQDFNMPEGETKGIAALLIEAPGGKTRKDNLDHFIKGGTVPAICYGCAATALFTLQTNAPSGGVGHRVGLRGGGPLTTLLRPQEIQSPLWKSLWLNVLDRDSVAATEQPLSAQVLPWMGPTRVSDSSGVETAPSDGHPLQMYWGMPRRIRLEADDVMGRCTLCGAENQPLVTHYRTRNYGTNYTDHWIHPLTPYRFDPKQKTPPFSLKGQKGGLGYRHWIGLALGKASNGDVPAKIVQRFVGERDRLLAQGAGFTPRLWCFGYDMDNMKARCWYDHSFPVFCCSPAQQEQLLNKAGELLELAQLAVRELRGQVKAAWFKRAKDAKGDISYIDAEFWQQTESVFFDITAQLSQWNAQSPLPVALMQQWRKTVVRVLFDTFDRWTLENNSEDLNLKRIMAARAQLEKLVYSSTVFKAFAKRYPQPEKETA